MDILSTKYRITYEAFSKLSGRISKARNIEELVLVTSKNLKYLMDFQVFRISILMDHNTCSFTFFANNGSKIEGNKLCDFERDLLKNKIPLNSSDIPNKFNEFTDITKLTNPLFWGWFMGRNTLDISTTILSDDTKVFTKTDIDIMHLLVDGFTSKYQQLYLGEQLILKNKSLEDAVKLVADKNKEIEKILGHQQNVIIDKTKEVKLKNTELLEISNISAHNLREPLSRILGLIEISEYYNPEQLKEDIIKHIKTSAKELDEVLKNVVEKSENSIKNSDNKKDYEFKGN
ncbi:hypothetical protein [Algibacter sp. L1A34]|uniref:hypothetical protein n=1 Tax=Algibacter sp. L1A34 TaxID=2686365 RepID=UPI00131B214B|nr:hypothetical protein [Algibacter sp. L1A34]